MSWRRGELHDPLQLCQLSLNPTALVGDHRDLTIRFLTETAPLFLAVFASAGLIPTIFEPGRIELLLSKPVRRSHILIGRYLGNLLVIAFNMLYLVFSIWLILGIKTDIWTPQFLYSIPLAIFSFAVLLTIVLLIAVLSESAVLSTMVTFGIMITGLIVAQKATFERLLTAEWSRNVVRGLYYALPKIWDLGNIGRRMVIGAPVESWMPLWSSAIFAAVMLSSSAARARAANGADPWRRATRARSQWPCTDECQS